MGLTARPSKNIDLTKIDDIQSEFFGDEPAEKNKSVKTKRPTENKLDKSLTEKTSTLSNVKIVNQNVRSDTTETKLSIKEKTIDKASSESKEIEQGSLTIADLLATAKAQGIRHTSRPYTVPRSLTIDLTRLKSKFRTRNLQYTQNELMDKMLKESLEFITAHNFSDLREKAFKFVKSPEQCSRRSVTLTEETVSEMNELKADLALTHNRRFSADEIFTTLLAVAFLPLYENELL